MKILVDINIWIDIALRPMAFPESKEALIAMQKRSCIIGFPLCGYTTLYYLLSQHLKKTTAALEFIKILEEKKIVFLGFDQHEVNMAQTLTLNNKPPVKDHEDACIVATAFTNKYDWILTRNLKDFKKQSLPRGLRAATPKQLLGWY